MATKGLKETVLSPGFLFKLIALLLIVLVFLWWCLLLCPARRHNPFPGISLRGEWIWIGYTIPAYIVILPITLVLYFIEKPGPWYHRLLFISGVVFFLTTGIMMIHTIVTKGKGMNDWEGSVKDVYFHPHFFALVCIVVSILFFVDALENEGVLEFIFPFLRKSSWVKMSWLDYCERRKTFLWRNTNLFFLFF